MSNSCFRFDTLLKGIGGLLVVGFFSSIWWYFASLLLKATYNQAVYMYKITHLVVTNCTIIRATMDSDEGFVSWYLQVNYTTPVPFDPTHTMTHLNFVSDAHPNNLYAVNQTIPCFYATSDFDYVTLDNDGIGFVDVFGLVMFLFFCVPFVIVPLGLAATFVNQTMPPIGALVWTMKDHTVSAASVIMKRWRRFIPLAQSEEEVHDLENTVDSPGDVGPDGNTSL
jgi:hypothetical protein